MNLEVVTQTGRAVLRAQESVSGKFVRFLFILKADPKMPTSVNKHPKVAL